MSRERSTRTEFLRDVVCDHAADHSEEFVADLDAYVRSEVADALEEASLEMRLQRVDANHSSWLSDRAFNLTTDPAWDVRQ